MYRASYKPPTEVYADIQNAIRTSPTLMQSAVKRNGGKVLRAWEDALQVEPPAASNFYPLRYKSAKQRRKVHALRRERGGGAYVRTHALVKAWKVKADIRKDGGAVNVTNKNPAQQFVYGDADTLRQPMFDPARGGIPWLNPDAVNAKFALQYGDMLEATWFGLFGSETGGRR